jgi:hypothetical protein
LDLDTHRCLARVCRADRQIWISERHISRFARATLERLGLASERTLEAYEALFHRGEPAAFPVLMQAQAAS